jgi:hypothetical protein
MCVEAPSYVVLLQRAKNLTIRAKFDDIGVKSSASHPCKKPGGSLKDQRQLPSCLISCTRSGPRGPRAAGSPLKAVAAVVALGFRDGPQFLRVVA